MNALAQKALEAADVDPIADRIENLIREKGSLPAAQVYRELQDTDRLAVAKALRLAIERHIIKVTDDLTLQLR
jgi:hypothetical protein